MTRSIRLTSYNSKLNSDESSELIQLIRKIYGMSSHELDTCPRPQEDVKDFTTPSSGSQSNGRATLLISSYERRIRMSLPNPDEPAPILQSYPAGQGSRESTLWFCSRPSPAVSDVAAAARL